MGRGWVQGLIVFVAVVMLGFTWRTFESFDTPKEALLKIGTLLLGMAVIRGWWREREIRVAWGPIVMVAVAWWAWGWVSLAVSSHPVWTFRFQWYQFHFLLLMLILPLVLHHQDRLLGFWRGVVVIGGIVASIAVMQYVGLDYEQGLRLLELTDTLPKTEIYSTIGNPNYLAAALSFLLPIGLVLAVHSSTPPSSGGTATRTGWAVLLWGCAAVITAAILLTQSKGGLLAGAGALAALWWLHGWWRRWPLWKLSAGLLAWAIGVGLLLMALANMPSIGQEWAKLTRLSWDDPSVKGRLLMWQTTLAMVADHPVIGIGAGTYGAQYQPYRARVFERLPDPAVVYPAGEHSFTEAGHAHSDYLQIVAETGVVGLSLFLGLVVLCFITGLKLLRVSSNPLPLAPHPLPLLLCGILSALAAILIHAMVDFPLHQPVAALLFWLGIGTVAAISIQQNHFGHRLLRRPLPWASWQPVWRGTVNGAVGISLLLLAGFGMVHAIKPVMASAYQREAWGLMMRERWPEAVAVIEKGLAWDPNQAELTLYLGVSHYQRGDFPASRAAYQRYQLLYSDYQTLYNLGLIAIREGEFSKAETYFLEALYYKPTLTEAAAALALVAERMGRPDQAQHWRRRAVDLRDAEQS